jgi:hypothetical protein
MLALTLAAALLANTALAAPACSDLVTFTAPADTGMGRDIDWEREVEAAAALLADARRPDCAGPLTSELSAAMRAALDDGALDEDTAGTLMARASRIGSFSREIGRTARLLAQGMPDQAQRSAQDASDMLVGSGLAEELGSARANRMEALTDDLASLGRQIADLNRQLGAGDHLHTQQGAETLWAQAERWCAQDRLGAPQCEAITSAAANLMGQVADRGQGSVPYLYQQRNTQNPDSSGANTCIAMLLAHFGADISPDEITTEYGNRYADKAAGAAGIFNDYAVRYGLPVRLIPHSSGTLADVDRQLDSGTPTIVHGSFDNSGHAVIALRKSGGRYVVNDPGGRWTGVFRGGYGYSRATDGQNAEYSGGSFRAAVGTHDGVNSAPVQWQELRWVE